MREKRFLLVAGFAFILLGAVPTFAGEKPDRKVQLLLQTDHPSLDAVLASERYRPQLSLPDERAGHKSVFKAVLFSLLLPGMGELYAGGFKSGKYFLVAESGLWLAFSGFEIYGHWVQNDARKFAATNASAVIEGKDDQFFVNIANFNNVHDYNEKKLRDRDPRNVYDPNGPYFWQWDNEQSRMRFRDLRVKSDQILNNVRFVVGGIILNHVASAINAARVARSSKAESSESTWDFQAGLLGPAWSPTGVGMTVRKSF